MMRILQPFMILRKFFRIAIQPIGYYTIHGVLKLDPPSLQHNLKYKEVINYTVLEKGFIEVF